MLVKNLSKAPFNGIMPGKIGEITSAGAIRDAKKRIEMQLLEEVDESGTALHTEARKVQDELRDLKEHFAISEKNYAAVLAENAALKAANAELSEKVKAFESSTTQTKSRREARSALKPEAKPETPPESPVTPTVEA